MSRADKDLQTQFLDVAFLDCSSPPDGAIFFSGPRAKRAANQASMRGGDQFKTVLESEALTEFNRWQPLYFGRDAKFTVAEAYYVGDCISESFARNASGTVSIYLDGIKPHGTFARAELPTLLANPNVDRFLVYDYASADIQPGQTPKAQEMDKEGLSHYIQSRIQGIPDRRLGTQRVEKHVPAVH